MLFIQLHTMYIMLSNPCVIVRRACQPLNCGDQSESTSN